MAEGDGKKELNDVRADFMCSYVCKTMRLRIEKWTKMMATDEYRALILDYLAEDSIRMLVISTNNAGALVPTYEFSATAKGKVVYFARKKPVPIPMDNFRDVY